MDEKCRQAYDSLKRDSLKNGLPLDEDIKQRVIEELREWEQYFLSRCRQSLETNELCNYFVREPGHWRAVSFKRFVGGSFHTLGAKSPIPIG